ncbi:MAG: hypothetical protein NC341_02815 [Blautia sp.]|nr:hypothetical protein [Blautia sp.]MCM1200549.1 hypothetical protein [Bacteroides fragilis]
MKIFILLGLFIIVMYVYTFVKLKKNREKTRNINSVQDFHDSYQHLSSGRRTPENTGIQQNRQESYRRYVTKYNSSEDYREK